MSVSRARTDRPRRRWIWALVALVTAAVLVAVVALLAGSALASG